MYRRLEWPLLSPTGIAGLVLALRNAPEYQL
jgi:hypothetical protein